MNFFFALLFFFTLNTNAYALNVEEYVKQQAVSIARINTFTIDGKNLKITSTKALGKVLNYALYFDESLSEIETFKIKSSIEKGACGTILNRDLFLDGLVINVNVFFKNGSFSSIIDKKFCGFSDAQRYAPLTKKEISQFIDSTQKSLPIAFSNGIKYYEIFLDNKEIVNLLYEVNRKLTDGEINQLKSNTLYFSCSDGNNVPALDHFACQA